MIKTEKGQTQLEGTGGELLTDLSVISESLYKALKENGEGEGAKKIILKAVELGFKTKEELDKEIKNDLKEALKKLLSKLDD